MTSITTAGVGSGMDIDKMLTGLRDAESVPATKRMDLQEAKLQEQLSAVGTFKGAVSDFRSALAGVKSTSTFQNLKATASDDALLSASTTSIAQAGSYSVKVTQLAQAQKLATSASNNFTSVSQMVGSGTLTFQFGTVAGGVFTDNPAKTAKAVTITAANNTLDGLRNAINDANIGVRANIVQDGANYRLTLGVTDLGAANSLKISVTDDDGNATNSTGLSLLAYDPTLADGVAGKNMTETVKAQNAQLTVDGLAVSSASNTVVGVVPGVTLNLKSAKPNDAAATLTIAQDSSGASNAVGAVVTAYNKLIQTQQSLTFYNAKTGQKGAMLGDPGVRSIMSQVRNLLTGWVAGATGSLRSLSDAGLSLQRDGSLTLDSSKLQAALVNDPKAVAGLFTRTSRTSDALVSLTSVGSTNPAGAYALDVTRMATQAQFAGLATTAITVGATNDTFSISSQADGSNAQAITLMDTTYASGADLATEIQGKLNTAFGAGIMTVAYNTDHLQFTSTTGSLQFTAVGAQTEATLGFKVGAGSAGVYTGAATALTLDASNNAFNLIVDGTQSGAITLTQGTYTRAQLAVELQSRINSDSALQGAGLTLSAAYSAGQFLLTSNTYGSGSSIEFTQASAGVQATFGISNNRVTGQDIAGTIGGVDATGSGRKLTGAGNAAGLAVEVQGGVAGPRGTVSISDGVAQRLDTMLGDFLSSDGTFSGRTDNINKQIGQISDQRTALTKRLDALEARYRAQFLTMDKLVSQFAATSKFLTQQLSTTTNNQ